MKGEKELAEMNPKEFWKMVRRGEWRLPTIQPCEDYLKAGFCIIPDKIPLMITQSPAHMFITDRLTQQLIGC